MKVKQVYRKISCGGIGYGDRLLRYKNKYYQIPGNDNEFKKLFTFLEENNLLITPRFGLGRYSLWLKHKDDNVVSGGKFMKILEGGD